VKIYKYEKFLKHCYFPEKKSIFGTYELTGDVGNFRYMAPEVALQYPYNEKVSGPYLDHAFICFHLV